MKDPLQVEETPYEVLGIGPEAGDGEVDAAWRAAMAGGDPERATAAWQVLKRPLDRAILDVLHYEDGSLGQLDPSPLDDPGSLELANRDVTAAAWEEHLQARFPELGTLHCLAVLWYWWARRESEADTGDGPVPVPSELWEGAIACWASLIATEGFWVPRWGPDLAADVGGGIERLLRDRLDELSRERGGGGEGAEAERYRALELAFTTELRTARALGSTAFGDRFGSSGPMLLERVGLLDTVATEVERALEGAPGDPELSLLREVLSPYARISILIEEGRVDEALDAIDQLPEEAREGEMLQTLHARALILRGEQQADLGDPEVAMDSWSLAIRTAPREDESAEARANVARLTRERAAALSEDREAAIALLERGESLTGDPSLRSMLAELLFERGVEAINAAQGAGTDADLRPGLKDLEAAAGYGSERALEQAGRAGAPIDWDVVAGNLLAAEERSGGDVPGPLRRGVAISLVNRAGVRVGEATDLVRREAAPSMENFVEAFMALTSDFELSGRPKKRRSRWRKGPDPCVVCGEDAGERYPVGSGEMKLCDEHAAALIRAVEGASAATAVSSLSPEAARRVKDRIELAERDLTEAARRWPDLDGIEARLREFYDLRVRMGLTPRTGPQTAEGFAEGAILAGRAERLLEAPREPRAEEEEAAPAPPLDAAVEEVAA
ncbi:MAG: hypothetical protein HY658_05575 [Actinobacteria bacterium]|nr:hypothetical protein [Actinomycetota bacterium]